MNNGGNETLTNTQAREDDDDEQEINNLFIGTIMHLNTKANSHVKGRCNTDDTKTVFDNEHENGNESWEEVSCSESKHEGKEVESDSDTSWYKLNTCNKIKDEKEFFLVFEKLNSV